LKIEPLGPPTLGDTAEVYITIKTRETRPEAISAALLACAQQLVERGITEKILLFPIPAKRILH